MPGAAPTPDTNPVDPPSEVVAGEPAAGDSPAAANEATVTAEAEAGADPDELMKQKYRDAMAHKHGASGASKKGHGDAGTSGHSQSAGPTQKLFRRKSGG